MFKKKIAAILAGLIIVGSGLTVYANQKALDITDQGNNEEIVVEEKNPTGWIKKDNRYNYVDEQGNAATGWNKIDNKWYFFDENGDMVTGWKQIDGKWYYMHEGGSMATGDLSLKGVKYFMHAGGSMATGIINRNGETYMYGNNGALIGKGIKYISNASAYTGDTMTSTGQRPRWGTIAVDPRVIPYGSRVYIPYFDKIFIANDRGGAIKGTKIDIFMKSAVNMRNFGRRNIPIIVFK